MKIRLINFLLLVFAVPELFSQQTFTIQVKNQKNEVLEYPEISIPKKVHKIGTKEGTLLLSNNSINLGDSIIVSHLGYDTEIVLVDNEMINKKNCEIILYEKTYFLEPLIVNRNDFNAEAFFKKKKKKILLPYYRKYGFNVDFQFFMPGDSPVSGQVTCHFQNAVVNLDSTVLHADSIKNEILKKCIKRGSEINYLTANIFCHSRFRKKFYCDYKGIVDGLDCWEFSIRPQTNKLWDLLQEDEFLCLVSIDEHGFISNIETQLTSHSDKSQSYLLKTNYTLYQDKLVAANTFFKILPNAANNENSEFFIEMIYSDFQRL